MSLVHDRTEAAIGQWRGASVPARWAGPDQGTYVYFGTLAPIEYRRVRPTPFDPL